MNIKASLLFINLDNAEILKNSLKSLMPLPLSVELIIIDSGSKDESQKILKQFQENYQYQYKDKIRIFYNRKKPFSVNEARLFGLKQAEGDIIIFGDTDCIYPKEWINFILENFNTNKNISLVFGPRLPDSGKGLGALIRRIEGYQSRKYLCREIKIFNKESNKIFYIAGSNFAIKKQILENIGLFDPLFTELSFEDVDLEERLLKNRFSLLFDPRLLIKHCHNLSYFGLLKKTTKSGRGFIHLSLKHNKQIFIGKYSLFWEIIPSLPIFGMIFVSDNMIFILLLILSFYLIIFYKVFHRRFTPRLFFIVLFFAPLIAIKDIIRASALIIEYFKIKSSA